MASTLLEGNENLESENGDDGVKVSSDGNVSSFFNFHPFLSNEKGKNYFERNVQAKNVNIIWSSLTISI